MKKLFLVLLVLSFAVSSHAFQAYYYGEYGIGGYHSYNEINRSTLPSEGDPASYEYYEQWLEFYTWCYMNSSLWVQAGFQTRKDHVWANDDVNHDLVLCNEANVVYQGDLWTFTGGLMYVDQWGTMFGNEAYDTDFQILAKRSTSFGYIRAYTRKMQEMGYEGGYAFADAEKDDSDLYAIGTLINFGSKVKPINFMPQVTYYHDSAADKAYSHDGNKIYELDISFDTEINNVGLEFEYVFRHASRPDVGTLDDDYEIWGLYTNMWVDLDPWKIGGMIILSDVDKSDAGTQVGVDSGDAGQLFLGLVNPTNVSMGNDMNGEDYAEDEPGHLTGFDVYSLYGEYALTENVTLTGQAFYYKSNYKEDRDNDWASPGSQWYGARQLEGDIGLRWNIFEGIDWTFKFGYAKLNVDEEAWVNYHRNILADNPATTLIETEETGGQVPWERGNTIHGKMVAYHEVVFVF